MKGLGVLKHIIGLKVTVSYICMKNVYRGLIRKVPKYGTQNPIKILSPRSGSFLGCMSLVYMKRI